MPIADEERTPSCWSRVGQPLAPNGCAEAGPRWMTMRSCAGQRSLLGGYGLADAGPLPLRSARPTASRVILDVCRISPVVCSRGRTGAVGKGDTRPRCTGGVGSTIVGTSTVISRESGWGAAVVGRGSRSSGDAIGRCCRPRGSFVSAGAERGKRECEESIMLQDGLVLRDMSDGTSGRGPLGGGLGGGRS